MTRILFVHGAGGFVEDRPLADAFGELSNASVDMPHLPDEDMSVEAWADIIRESLSAEPDFVVGHSFGATILLHVLATTSAPSVSTATLLAMPDWSADGWDVPEYRFTGPEPALAMSLHHCRDDDIVSFDHLALNSAVLPRATVHEYPRGGHQFEGVFGEPRST